MQSFFKNDFSEEVAFGIRYEPANFSNILQNSILLMAVIDGDEELSVSRIEFTGKMEEEEPCKPSKMTRSSSTMESSSNQPLIRPMLMRATSLEEGDGLEEPRYTRTGTVRAQRIDGNCHYILLNIDNNPDFSFVPVNVKLACTVGLNQINVQISLAPYSHFAPGVVFKRSSPIPPRRVYERLLQGISTLSNSEHTFHQDNHSLTWMHGAVLSFIREFAYSFAFGESLSLTNVLTYLSDAFVERAVKPWIILVAIGHTVGTFEAVGKESLIRDLILPLWQVPQAVLLNEGKLSSVFSK
jgi:hypothetical protein